MASLNLAGKASGYVKLKAPDDSSNNPTVELPTESGELALKSDITGGGGGIPEAPVDGKQYARKDADWSEVEASGGGSTPTPEDLVWEDKLAEREFDKEFTNDNNVPIYLSVNSTYKADGTSSAPYITLYIDGVKFGSEGMGYTSVTGDTTDSSLFQTTTFVIPSGKTYELKAFNDVKLNQWKEARMPLAIAVGDASSGGEVTEKEAVVFKGAMSKNQTLESTKWTKLDLSIGKIDTNNALVDGAFKPSVEGWYQVSGAVSQSCNPDSTRTMSGIFKNGTLASTGSYVRTATGGISYSSNVTDIIYLNGTTDYVELHAQVETTGGTVEVNYPETLTYLSAHLITGQSTGGGSGEATGTPSSFARIVDEKPQDTDGGDATNGIQDRTLNKIEYDKDNIVTLSDNKEFTLQKGTYVIDFSAPSYIALNTNAWLWSVTDNKKVMQGSTEYGNNSTGMSSVHSTGRYTVTLTEPHTYKIQHYFNNASGKLGNASKSGVGIFTTVDIQKVGTGGASSGGGKTVAFRGEMSADQTVATTGMTKVNLDEASIDTDSSFVDGKFQPSVSGYYQVNGAITQNSNPQSKNLQSAIYKNGVEVSRGSQTILSEDTEGSTQDSVVSDIVYLNGTTDYIELYGSCDSTGTRSIFSGKTRTYLSAVLVSGGSASGDSIWTEEDGKAVYDGDISANGITVGSGGGNGNSILGYNALLNTTGKSSVAVGFDALKDNVGGSYLTAIGRETLQKNTEGKENTAVGYQSLQNNEIGNKNIAVGSYALQANNADENTALGYSAGNNITTGTNNTCIGYFAQPSAPDVSNEVTIGNDEVTKTRLKGEVSIVDNIISSSTLQFNTDGTARMQIKNDGLVGILNIRDTVQAPNVYIDGGGDLYKSTTATYSAEEVDKKLAIKDKLIEKLSDRLDKLEKKLKKTK